MKKLVVVIGIIFIFSCSRSEQYEQNESPYGDQTKYYSGPNSSTLTQKAQSMVQPKNRVMVLAFWNHTPVRDNSIGQFAATELMRELHTTKKVIIPMDVKTTMSTSDFIVNEGEKIRVDQLIREGKKLGVRVMVLGRISNLAFRQKGDEIGIFRKKETLAATDIEIKIFDVQSGREIAAVGRSGYTTNQANITSEDENLESQEFRSEMFKLALRSAIKQSIPDVLRAMDKMSWIGKVAKVVGNQVYVNSGRSSGLVRGDILRVLTAGEDIYDPSTGAFLGKTNGQLKGTLEVVDFIGPDASVAVVHTGGSVAENDLVRLY